MTDNHEFHERTEEESLECFAAYERFDMLMSSMPDGLTQKEQLIWIGLIGTMSSDPIWSGAGSAAVAKLARLLKDEAKNQASSPDSSSSSPSSSSSSSSNSNSS